MVQRVCVYFAVLGTNPDTETMLFAGRLLVGSGPMQADAEQSLLQATTVGQLIDDGVLDEVTAMGMAGDRPAWLLDTTGGGDGVVAVLVEVAL